MSAADVFNEAARGERHGACQQEVPGTTIGPLLHARLFDLKDSERHDGAQLRLARVRRHAHDDLAVSTAVPENIVVAHAAPTPAARR